MHVWLCLRLLHIVATVYFSSPFAASAAAAAKRVVTDSLPVTGSLHELLGLHVGLVQARGPPVSGPGMMDGWMGHGAF